MEKFITETDPKEINTLTPEEIVDSILAMPYVKVPSQNNTLTSDEKATFVVTN